MAEVRKSLSFIDRLPQIHPAGHAVDGGDVDVSENVRFDFRLDVLVEQSDTWRSGNIRSHQTKRGAESKGRRCGNRRPLASNRLAAGLKEKGDGQKCAGEKKGRKKPTHLGIPQDPAH